MKLMDLLDDLDDVQDVHGNMDVNDDLMDKRPPERGVRGEIDGRACRLGWHHHSR